MAKKKMDFAGIAKRAGGVAAGVVVGKLANKVIPEDMDPKIASGIKVIAGAFIPDFVQGGKNEFVNNAGLGLMAEGLSGLIDEVAPDLGTPTSGDEPTEEAVEGLEDDEMFLDEYGDDDPIDADIEGLGDEDEDVLSGLGDDDDDVLL